MIIVPRPPLARAALRSLPRYAYAVRARGGDTSGGWVLAEGVARDREEGAAWLRAEALRLAVRLDPGPRSRWGRPPLVHEVPEGGPDAPTALRTFAEDRERLDTVRDLLAYGFPVALRFPDVRGAWYELAADPVPPGATPRLLPIEPPPCPAVTEVPALIADLARSCTPLPGPAPVTRMPCALTAHDSPEHVGAVRMLDRGAGAVWASFTDQLPPWRVRFMPPCPHSCPLFRDHPGRCRPPRREVVPVVDSASGTPAAPQAGHRRPLRHQGAFSPMTAQPARPRRGGSATASAAALVPPFTPSLAKTVFRDVTSLHVSRSAAWATAAVTRTVLAEIIDGARAVAAAEDRTKLVPQDLVSAIDRDVELEVGCEWYLWTPTFHGLTGVPYDADGTIVSPRLHRSPRTPSGVAGAHRFEAGTRKLLRSREVTAVPALVRDLDGIASVFLTDLARSAALVVREGGVKRFGTVTLGTPAGPPPPLGAADRALTTRDGDRRTIGRNDVLAATTMHLFPGRVRQRALAEAREGATEAREAATGAPGTTRSAATG